MKLSELPTIEPVIPTFQNIKNYIPSTRIEYIWEPKFQGIRCLCYWTREEGFYFSSQTDYRLRYVYQEFQEAFNNLLKPLPFNDLIFDGELIAVDPKNLLGNAVALASRSKVKCLLQYRIFDILWANDKPLVDFSLKARKGALEKYFSTVFKTAQIKLVPYAKEQNLLPEIFQNAPEFVLKDCASAYRSGKQVSWIKLAELDPKKFYVTGYTQGLGSQSDTFGSLEIVDERFEPVGYVYLGITDEFRDIIWRWIQENCKEEWRTFEVHLRYNRKTTDGTLHNPELLSWRFPGE